MPEPIQIATPPEAAPLHSQNAVVLPKRKDRRALSAYRHGITGQIVLLSQADQVAYDEHCRGYFKTYNPHTPVARDLVQLIADDRWRLKLASSVESAMLADEMANHSESIADNEEVDHALCRSRAFAAKGADINLISIYENRLQKKIDRNVAELRQHEADYAARMEKALEQADLLGEEAERNGEDVDQWIDGLLAGFVFSTLDMKRMLLRRRSLARARENRGKPKKAA